MSLSFATSTLFEGEAGMAWTRKHWIATAVALAACVLWAVFCLVLDWPLAGVAGVALGLVAGGSFYAVLRAHADPAAGLAAATIAGATLLVGSAWQQHTEESAARLEAASDQSYIDVLAEQILWQRSTQPPAAGTDTAIATADENVPGVGAAEIPPDVLAAATAQWRSMPAAEKAKLRQTRDRWLTASHGPQLDDHIAGPSWRARTTCAALSSVVALLVAAWPALAARYVGWGQD